MCAYGHLLPLFWRHININTVLYYYSYFDDVAVQIGYEKTAYTVTGRESEVEVCIFVSEAPVPAIFNVNTSTDDATAGKYITII